MPALSTPTRVQVAKYARNGLVPHAVFETQLASSLNFAGAARTKQLFHGYCPIANIPASTYSPRVRWRFAGHTGPLLRSIRARVLLALQNSGDPIATPPRVKLYITNADGSTVYGSGTFVAGYNPNSTPLDRPAEFISGLITISSVPADTDIYGRFEDGDSGGRLIAASVYEESQPLSSSGYATPVPVNGPIYNARRQKLYQLGTNLWKRGAAQLINWTVDNQATPLTTTSINRRNIIDNTSTAVTASTPGYTIDLRYCRTLMQSTVPCVLQAYGAFSSGTGGSVLLYGPSDNFLGAVSNWTSATPAWKQTTINLPANLDELELYFTTNGGVGTFSLHAVSLYQYAA